MYPSSMHAARLALLTTTLFTLAFTLPVRADTPPSGSSLYEIVVEDAAGADGIGVFGVLTGPGHPLGPGFEVLSLRETADAFSSYLTIRSYTTGTDYVQTNSLPASGNIVLPLEPYASLSSVAGGHLVSYDIPSSSPSAESLLIVAGVTVIGEGPSSAILLSVTVTNRNTYPIAFGARYLLDIANLNDDGPPVWGTGAAISTETPIEPPPAEVSLQPNGTVISAGLAGQGSPEAVVLAGWNRAFESAFDFAPDGSDVTSPGTLNDSALLYYLGATEADAVALQPAESVSFSLRIGEAPATIPSATHTPAATAPGTPGPRATSTPPPSATATPVPGPAAFPAAGGFLGIGAGSLPVLAAAGLGLVAASGAAIALSRRQSRNERR